MIHYATITLPGNQLVTDYKDVFLASMDLQPLMNASFCFHFMTITSLLYDQKLHHTSLAMTSHKS